MEAIDAGVLCVYSTAGNMPFWHASVGKNTAHVVASEEILVNVDCDNFIGPNFALDVVNRINNGSTVLQYEDGDGTCGRIAYWRDEFLHVGGYDEDCSPMGAQDIDLRNRLSKLNHSRKSKFQRVGHKDFPSQAIPNSRASKTRFCHPMYANVTWGAMNATNVRRFQARGLVRNQDRRLGSQVFLVAGREEATGGSKYPWSPLDLEELARLYSGR